MTPYEAQSLEVAKSALTTSIWADVIAGFALSTIIVGGIIGYLTLKAILGQLKTAQWSTLLSLEEEMANREIRFKELADQVNNNTLPVPSIQQFNAARESYFNAIDRFASLVLNGQFPEKELKQDYQDLIKETIRKFPDDFNTGTHFRKVVRLYNKWEDSK